jgi:hypothetical protein
MGDAGPHGRLRKDRVDCFPKALQAVDDGDEHVVDGLVFQLV